MQRSSAMVLQVVVVLICIDVLAALLWEPWVEGVNANATSIREVYFDDPFLAYIYFSFIAVFIGLYQVFKLLGYIGRDEASSQKSVQALRTIKYCALSFTGLIFAAVGYIFIDVRGSDDIAGGVAVGLFMVGLSLITAIAAALFERKAKTRLRQA